MLTTTAARAGTTRGGTDAETVTTTARLQRDGWSPDSIRAQLDARRWRRTGRAIVLHNGGLSRAERCAVALRQGGSRAVLAAFTAAELHGLTGWEREPVHLLVPAGTRVRQIPELAVRIHYAGAGHPQERLGARAVQRIAPALVLAAATLPGERAACALLAAGVQQRLVTAPQLRAALTSAPRVRHRRVLIRATDDIGQGAQALSEIDFVRLCRRHGLPEPVRQAVRVERHGRRRYLDAEWRRADGRHVVAEIDGALHLVPRRWWDDQLRQNELVLGGDLVLRFPSAVYRCEPSVVVDQLRRALS